MTRHTPHSDATTFSVWEAWAKGIVAAAIAGCANGIITGFAAVGIDPAHFNLQAGLRATLAIAMVSAAMSGIIGVAAYLKQSPLPPDAGYDRDRQDAGDANDPRADADRHDANAAHAGRDNLHAAGADTPFSR
ncbi:MAG: hypothetical protein WBF06_06955 [Candidatus Acidiferrales bacterium]